VKQFSGKPRLVAGNLLTPESAESYLADGHAEAAVLARALIVDAEWANKARRGESVCPVDVDVRSTLSVGIDPGVR
jgi:2,4-dienoyl-CoA reductase-like NADH-dependent reductase (Old Yellow Enzyme family)